MTTTSDLIRAAEQKDATAMKDALEAILARKAYDALEVKRQAVAKDLIRNARSDSQEG